MNCEICHRPFVAFRDGDEKYAACPIHNAIFVSADEDWARARDESMFRGEPFVDEGGK